MTKSLVEFHGNADAFSRRLKEKSKEIQEAGRRGLTIITEDWIKRQKKSFAKFDLASYDQSVPGQVRSRRGRLRSSVRGSVKGTTLKDLRARLMVGSAWAPYARIQEYGGTITSKGKLMTIPLKDALTGGGKIKSKARIHGPVVIRNKRSGKSRKVWTTGYGINRVIKSKAGNLIIVSRPPGKTDKKTVGRGAKKRLFGKALYVLKRTVKLEPRLGAYKRLRQVVRKRMPRLRGAIFQILAPPSMLKGGR
jgi:hypothetical protein